MRRTRHNPVERLRHIITDLEILQSAERLPALQRRLGSLVREAKKIVNDFSPDHDRRYDLPGRENGGTAPTAEEEADTLAYSYQRQPCRKCNKQVVSAPANKSVLAGFIDMGVNGPEYEHWHCPGWKGVDSKSNKDVDSA